ncbi:transposase [Actinomadura rudentiformis]|uniref:Transposase n=1 Tax=Actinomadura rudentiformis TaxID=359158 RepID=A0A6H9YIQ8_9ACTN|nr:transposase [Actinomadura rudentiformis]
MRTSVDHNHVWRDIPSRYGPWQTVYELFAAGSGLECGPGSALQTRADRLTDRQVNVDSTICRATSTRPVSAVRGMSQKEAPGSDTRGESIEPADHRLGRSRDGLTTKIHPACERLQL